MLIADIAGFWRPLLGLIAHMRKLGFLREGADVHYIVAERAEDIVPMLRERGPPCGAERPRKAGA